MFYKTEDNFKVIICSYTGNEDAITTLAHLRQEVKIKASRNNFLLQVNSPGGARADGKKGVEHLHTGHLQNTQLLATSSTTTTTAMCAVSSHQRHRRVHNAPFTPSFHSLSYIPNSPEKAPVTDLLCATC